MNEHKRINASIAYILDKLETIKQCESKIRDQIIAISKCEIIKEEEEFNCYMPYSFEHTLEQHFPSKPLS